MLKKILYILLFMFSTLSHANQLQCNTQCNKTEDKKLIIQGIKLFQSTLEDLYKQFGKASIYSPYENNPRYICYVSDNQNDETAIVFSSYDTVEGVEIYKYKSQILPMLNCTKSEKVSENIAFESGLKLNIRERDYRKINRKNTYNGIEEIVTFECCNEQEKSKNENMLYTSIKFLKNRIYYIKVKYFEYYD